MFKETLHIPYHTPPATSRNHNPSLITNIFSTCHQGLLQKQQRELLSREQLFPYCQMSLGRTLCTADLEGPSFILVLVASPLATWRKTQNTKWCFSLASTQWSKKRSSNHTYLGHTMKQTTTTTQISTSRASSFNKLFTFRASALPRSQSVRVISGSSAVTFRSRTLHAVPRPIHPPSSPLHLLLFFPWSLFTRTSASALTLFVLVTPQQPDKTSAENICGTHFSG